MAMLAFRLPPRAQDEAKEKAKKEARAEEAAEPAGRRSSQHDPGDPTTLDLYYGAGGKDMRPDPNGTFTFVEEDMQQTQPKFDVMDAQGGSGGVKLGEEPQAETAATRLVWAAGYFVDEDYFLG